MIDLIRLFVAFAPSYRAYVGLAASSALAVSAVAWIRAVSLMATESVGAFGSLV